MNAVYLVDYFLFVFFASFAVIQISLTKRVSARLILGTSILLLAYLWFFGSKDRSIPTIVEGVQLFVVFGLATALALAATKLLIFLKTK